MRVEPTRIKQESFVRVDLPDGMASCASCSSTDSPASPATHALLAIAEQLRISNLIALAESESPTLGEPAYRATEALARWTRTTNEGVDSDHWALRPNIAAALGIEAES